MNGVLSMGQQGPVQPVSLGEADNVGATQPSSPYTFSYNLTSLPSPVSFSGVTASWNGLSVTAPPNFTTLGPYRFSQYNTIYENTCGAGQTPAFIFQNNASSCTYTVAALRPDFVTQATENGTGVAADPSIGLIQAFRATGLFNSCGWPEGSNQDPNTGNVFVSISQVAGPCNTQLASGSLATNPNPKTDPSGQWNCSDQVMLLNSNSSIDSTRAVQDFCPACSSYPTGTNGHIDMYSSTQACYKVGDYPNSPLFGIRLR